MPDSLADTACNPEFWRSATPIAGSMLLFAGAMFSLWRTNRAADRRAHQSWRRDAELRAVAEVLAVSSEAIVSLKKFQLRNESAAEAANSEVVAASHKISVRAAELRLLTESSIPALCDKLSTALRSTSHHTVFFADRRHDEDFNLKESRDTCLAEIATVQGMLDDVLQAASLEFAPKPDATRRLVARLFPRRKSESRSMEPTPPQGTRAVTCPRCNAHQNVANDLANYECSQCKQVTLPPDATTSP